MWQNLSAGIKSGDSKSIAKAISFVENDQPGYDELLQSLHADEDVKIIGITGPPGAGKSTITDALIAVYIGQKKKVAVLCVDPSSPFNLGAILGDRIRMGNWYTHPDVFIRSLATRGSMGGLHPKIIEISDLLKSSTYDVIIIETVGVGQSEIEIAGLADTTVVVVVPEAGDEVQTMKSGLMEIADIFVVNKSDRPGADLFVKNLMQMMAPAFHNHEQEVPVIKTVATQQSGIAELVDKIDQVQQHTKSSDRKFWLLAEKAFHLIQQQKMKGVNKKELKLEIEKQSVDGTFNLFSYVKSKS
jgi:LAO/AO transport system kinase